MLSNQDKERGYPVDKEETALFQLFLIVIFLLMLAFFAGQIYQQFFTNENSELEKIEVKTPRGI